MSESPDETAERSTGLMHIAKAAFPTVNLAPWMTIHTKAEVWILSGMETVADIGEELERRTWLDEQDKNGTFGSAMEKMENPEQAANGKKEDFDIMQRRGGLSMITYFNRRFITNLSNRAPSEKGLGRKQALTLGLAQKTGVAVEPKPRSRWEKLTGKGKERGQIAGME